ncbi:MAG: tryptophan--tRNA ligase, partial [Kibdelosporangium sp.]
LIGSGIAPERVFVQSDIARDLAALTWMLECTSTFGEVARMIQFKEKSAGAKTVRLGLLTYPVLMAADILLQGADEVPVGDDQAQHVELARVLARRFNTTYGDVFVVPQAVTPKAAARIRDLADPSRKMAKSTRDSAGVVFLLDSPDTVRRKFRRAVTDGLDRVGYDPVHQPGVANLLEILGACTGVPAKSAADGITTYGALKDAAADAVIEELRPVRKMTMDLLADPAELDRIRTTGADRAAERGAHRLAAGMRVAGIG